jgi:hypothetical protein
VYQWRVPNYHCWNGGGSRREYAKHLKYLFKSTQKTERLG